MKKKKLLILFGSAILMVLAVTGYALGLFGGTGQEDCNSWRVGAVSRRDIGSSVLATGIIKSSIGAEVRVGSRVSGILKRLYVKIGDPVNKGQLLGELDPTEYQARVNQAQAAVDNANARLDYAALNLKRLLPLRKKDFISQDELDAANSANDMAVSDLKQAKANLDYAGIQLGYTRIHAPISGVVAAVSTQEGETVVANFAAPTFVVIIDPDRIEVWAYVDETDIGRIQKGQKATFTVDTYAGTDFEGVVRTIYPKAEMRDNVVNYATIIDISNNKGLLLRPEMTATVKIYQQSRPGVLTVPKLAVKRDDGKDGKKYVLVLKGSQPQKRWIDEGWNDGKYTEITHGLVEGEKIIIDSREDLNKW